MKKVFFIICLLLTLLLSACGNTQDITEETPTSPAGETAATITGPVTVTFWHNYSDGLKDEMNALIQEFNETNTYGITVESVYAGNAGDIQSVIKQNYTTDNVPDIFISGSGQTEIYAESGVLADLAPTLLDIMKLPQPKEMTGASLIKK